MCFHSLLKHRRGSKTLSSIQIGENIINDPIDIAEHVSSFYQHLFSDPVNTSSDLSIIREHVSSLVTVDENTSILRVPSFDEVRNTVFAMDPMSAPGPDGLSGIFYSHCWEIMGHDVVLVVQDFFHSGRVFPGLNSNFLVLIPKILNALLVEHFHPIALGNFLFKVITKIIADHLAKICSRIISPNQFGFIRGRQIGDCIAGASECFNVLNNYSHSGHLALKIDIRKAFNSIS
ncbi:hypothetical protein Ddye_007967 [Dipteronia dyeriana]|uniref:Reverse transcriptase domain-containing protein n=1 Tax=Dipteronia dyeriana TaxID=168575 RepID=A0AAD9X8L9_9ROSI|nr:hypothetical protein Ddye_007967 [Dipteronia dyeriana]